MTTLSGKLPKGERDGLSARVAEFVQHPTRAHVAIVVVDTAKVTTDVDTGEQSPGLRIRVQTNLDLDLEDEISELFREAAIDHATGELHIVKDEEDDTDGK
jgi:hypothetical protein